MLGAPGRSDRATDEVASRLALLHATDPSTVHLALHVRTDATQAELDAALYDDRLLLRHTCLRRTVFAMPADVAPLAHGACSVDLVDRLRSNLVGWLANAEDPAIAELDEAGRAAWLAGLEDEVVAYLDRDGAATGNELADAVEGMRVRFEPMPGKAYSRAMRCTSKVLEIVAADGRIARGRPTGDLTSSAVTWEAMSNWWPEGLSVPDDPLPPLLARYLDTFGPATTADMAWWTGLGKTKARAAMATLGAVRVTCEDDEDAEAWVLADDVDTEPELAGLHAALLPGLDSVSMGHKQRAWWLGDADLTSAASALYDHNGNAGPIAWVGGRAVGAWDQRDDGEVVVGLLEDVGSEAEAALAEEAARTSAWLGDVRVRPRYPVPLQKALHAGAVDGARVLG